MATEPQSTARPTAEHTPGPWRVNDDLDTSPVPIERDDTRERVAWAVFGLKDGISEAIANAHLIAAAPDLLAALKAALPLIVLATYEFRDDEEARLRYEAMQGVIIAAIAKAIAR